MCGRTACTLEPDALSKACLYTDGKGIKRQAKWKNDDSRKYTPSPNISPQSYSPVLVSCKLKPEENEDGISADGREIRAMKWGLVPSWHRADPQSFSYKMNNARIESIIEKKSFRGPLEKGQRCVVIAEGFYEWQTTKGSSQKQPYFVHLKHDVNRNCKYEEVDDINPGRPLLYMAGVYDVWQSVSAEEPLYSYSVITLEAKEPFRHIHHRVPAVLKDEEAVMKWLDSSEVDHKQALKLLSADDCLDWHPVTKAVGNFRYRQDDCMKEIDLSLAAKEPTQNKITNWFQAAPKKRELTDKDRGEPALKEAKFEQ